MADIQKFFDEKIRLPSPPTVALKILKAVRSDESSFDELAEIIKVDPALTAQVLKLANSSLYGLAKRVDSIAQATALIGTQTLKNIALSFVFVNKFKGFKEGVFDIDLFWRRAVTAAVATQVLSDYTACTNKDIFVSGLLQDIGVLLLFISDCDAYSELLDNKRVSGITIEKAENEKFGFDHAEAGCFLLERWDLSDTILGPIRYHHVPTNGKGKQYKDAALILSISDKIAAIYHGSKSSRKTMEVQNALQEHYDISQEKSIQIIDEIGTKAQEVLELFAIDPGEMQPLSMMIQEANEELRRLNLSYEQIVLELRQAKKNAEKLAIDLKKANDKLRELTIQDELTGLYNHRYFQETLDSHIEMYKRYGSDISLLMIDVDFFKKVNDNYGHLAGDLVLKELGRVLKTLVRSCDIVARYGGEEFGIILPETGTVGAKVLAQRLRRGIEQHEMEYKDTTISVTVSIGISGTDKLPAKEVSRENLFLKGDQALYKAKNKGRNRVEM